MQTLSIITFILLLVGILGLVVVWSLRNGISPMPTSLKAKRTLMNALPQKVQGTIYELGSGWGTLVFPLASRYPDCRVVGFETSPIPYCYSRLWLLLSPRQNLVLRLSDFYQEPLVDAALVVCYLYPEAMKILRGKFEKELPPGTVVVSNTFAIPGWTPTDVRVVDDLYKTKIYTYLVDKKLRD